MRIRDQQLLAEQSIIIPWEGFINFSMASADDNSVAEYSSSVA